MNKQDWKPFKIPHKALYRDITIRGRNVKVAVSPYDVPEAYQIHVDQEKLVITIDLKYIENEPGPHKAVQLSNGITCYVGKISNRVYKLDCKIDRNILVSEDSARLIQERTLEIVHALSLASGSIKERNSEVVQSSIAAHQLAF